MSVALKRSTFQPTLIPAGTPITCENGHVVCVTVSELRVNELLAVEMFRSWQRRALQRPYHDLKLSPCYRCCIGPRVAQREFSYHGRAHVPPRKPDVDAGDTSRGH